jgi:hypothetical protein
LDELIILLKEIQKVINNGPRNINFLEFQKVSFITDKTIGSVDFLQFEYDILSFDKIIEFDVNFVIKFVAKISTNGFDILEIYKEEELEEKYKNKEESYLSKIKLMSMQMSILEQNLKGERCAIQRYQEIADFTAGKDHSTHQMAVQILNEELEHENDIEDWINDITRMKEEWKKIRM